MWDLLAIWRLWEGNRVLNVTCEMTVTLSAIVTKNHIYFENNIEVEDEIMETNSTPSSEPLSLEEYKNAWLTILMDEVCLECYEGML